MGSCISVSTRRLDARRPITVPGVGDVLEECLDSQVCDAIRKRATGGSEGTPPPVEEILAANGMQPDVDDTREYWVPAPEQVTALAAIEDAGARAAI